MLLLLLVQTATAADTIRVTVWSLALRRPRRQYLVCIAPLLHSLPFRMLLQCLRILVAVLLVRYTAVTQVGAVCRQAQCLWAGACSNLWGQSQPQPLSGPAAATDWG